MTIWKYIIPGHLRSLGMPGMPEGAKILSCQNQDGNLCVWALVDPNKPKETVTFAIYGTGQDIPDNPGVYIDTVQVGCFVWHVFEVKKVSERTYPPVAPLDEREVSLAVLNTLAGTNLTMQETLDKIREKNETRKH